MWRGIRTFMNGSGTLLPNRQWITFQRTENRAYVNKNWSLFRLHNSLPPLLYQNFKHLALAIYSSVHPKPHSKADSTRNDLIIFLTGHEWRYEPEHSVYKVHSLKHPLDDVCFHGALDYPPLDLGSYMKGIRKSAHSIAKNVCLFNSRIHRIISLQNNNTAVQKERYFRNLLLCLT